MSVKGLSGHLFWVAIGHKHITEVFFLPADSNNGLAVHVAGTGHTIHWDEAEVVYREEQWTKRKIKESLTIKAHPQQPQPRHWSIHRPELELTSVAVCHCFVSTFFVSFYFHPNCLLSHVHPPLLISTQH